jgi:uncharacterized protein YcbK (DUF882 family)
VKASWTAATVGLALIVAAPAALANEPTAGGAVSAPAAITQKAQYLAEKQLDLAKKDRYLAEKQIDSAPEVDRAAWLRTLSTARGRRARPVINIYNHWTREYLAIDRRGEIDLSKAARNHFFRCRFTNQPTDMDPRLLEVLVQAARKFNAERVNIVSGYRSPKYNLMLQKKGRNVARDSQHTHGRAIDFRLPGVQLERLHQWVRSLRLGGVGFYTHSRFIHADTGPLRYWRAH